MPAARARENTRDLRGSWPTSGDLGVAKAGERQGIANKTLTGAAARKVGLVHIRRCMLQSMGSVGRRIKRKTGHLPGTQGSAVIEARLATLERLTIDSHDLSVPITYFHDEVAGLDVFARESRTGDPGLISQIVEASLKRTLPDFETAESGFYYLEAFRLWHGFASGAKQEFAAFYYFEDIAVGVAHVAEKLLNGKSQFIRFSGVPINAPVLPGSVTRGQG